MPSQSVLVIGGGLAGLSSAVALAEAGVGVRILEKRPHLGGRATSYTLPDGSEVDNCQHVTLGCCTNLADFYRRAGAEEKIKFYDTLYFADAKGRRSTISAAGLPAPLHLAPSFLFFSGLAASGQDVHREGAACDCTVRREAARSCSNDARLAAADETDAGSD